MPTNNELPTLQSLVNEKVRLTTFDQWSVPYINKKDLAKNGFYYRGLSDRVICIFCGVEIGAWEEGDDPEEEHRKYSPECPLLQITTDAGSFSRATSEYESGCVIDTRRRPEYKTVEERYNTFEHWPISMKQTPKAMAQAGFYYTGTGDRVVCFKCHLGVHKWVESDDPWVEHAKWSPMCSFVNQTKGEEFVQDVLKRAEETVKAEETAQVVDISKNGEYEDLLCTVCNSEKRTVVSIPCRHLATCKECNSKLVKCPICRKEEKDSLEIFIS